MEFLRNSQKIDNLRLLVSCARCGETEKKRAQAHLSCVKRSFFKVSSQMVRETKPYYKGNLWIMM